MLGKFFEGVLAAEIDKAFAANQSKLHSFAAKTFILAISVLLGEATSTNRQVIATFIFDAEAAFDVVWQMASSES